MTAEALLDEALRATRNAQAEALRREFPALTLADRCDADHQEAARIQVRTPVGDLMFCEHHAREYWPLLADYPNDADPTLWWLDEEPGR